MASNDPTFNEAKQSYMEQFGHALVGRTYLIIAVAILTLACFGLVLMNLKTIHTFRNFRPLVIRIDELGRAEAVNYHNYEYKPHDAEAKYFLSQFCTLYYRRNRFTMNEDFTKALYFLDGRLANEVMESHQNTEAFKNYIQNAAAPDVDVDVQKVTLEGLEQPPYKARVDFYLVEHVPGDPTPRKKTLYTATFVFLFKSNVPNELIPINPLGLTIAYFREDQAFK